MYRLGSCDSQFVEQCLCQENAKMMEQHGAAPDRLADSENDLAALCDSIPSYFVFRRGSVALSTCSDVGVESSEVFVARHTREIDSGS